MLKENKRTELKREFTKDIVKTVIAFANCEGGHLFICLLYTSRCV